MKFDPDRGLMKGDRVICRFEPVLAGVVNETDTDGKTVEKYEVKLRKLDGSESTTVVVKSLGKIDFFKEFHVPAADMTPRDRASVAAYLQEQYANAVVKKYKMVDRMGLVCENPLVYIFDKKTEIADKSVEIIHVEAIPEFPSGEYSQEEILNYLDRLMKLMPGVSDLLFLVELLAKVKPIFEVVGIDVDNFTVVYGFPGTFKTKMVELINMADSRQIQEIAKIKSRRLQELLDLFCGHTIIADDYHKQSKQNEREKQMAVLDHLGRHGGYKGGAYVVATGEYLEGTFSLQDRMIPLHTRVVPPGEKTAFSDELSWLQKNKAILWQFYREFCKIVYSDIQNVKDYIQKEFYVDEYQTIFRIERNTVFLEMAYSILHDWYLPKDYSAWDIQMKDSLTDMKKQAILHMKKVQKTQYDVDWAYEVCRIIPVPTMREIFEEAGYYFSDGYFNICFDTLKERLEEALECKVPMQEVVRDLKSKKLLYTDKSGANTVKRKGGTGVYAISLEAVDKYKEQNKHLK